MKLIKYLKLPEPLKYMKRAAFASMTIAGGIAIYALGEQYKESLVKAGGLVAVGWGMYEMIKNTALSVTSNFKKSLEGKVK